MQTPFLFVDLQWIVMYWSGKSIANDNKYNEYNFNHAAIKFKCICMVTFYNVWYKILRLYCILDTTPCKFIYLVFSKSYFTRTCKFRLINKFFQQTFHLTFKLTQIWWPSWVFSAFILISFILTIFQFKLQYDYFVNQLKKLPITK